GRETFVAMARQMGLTRGEAVLLADRMLAMPDKEVFFKGRIEDLDSKIKSGQAKVDALKQKRAVAVGANKSDLDRKVRDAQRAVDRLKQKRAAAIKASNQTAAGVNAAKRNIDSVKGKTVSVMVQYRASQNPSSFAQSIGALAHGGVVGAAGGGPRSRRTLVGEQGPEIVDLAPGSRVRSNPDTKRLLAGGHAGGGSAPQPIVLQVNFDGRRMAEVLIDPLRGEISRRGGNVQATLGRR
ncbi:hypothetical protein ACFWR1_37140, partial [Streptomyces sp. NPDC058603]